MKKIILYLSIIISLVGCNGTTDWEAERSKPETKQLLSDIENRSDVHEAILSDAGGLCVAMDVLTESKAEIIASYFIGMAENNQVNIKFCKIISSLDYKTDGRTYMSGTKLAFKNK